MPSHHSLKQVVNRQCQRPKRTWIFQVVAALARCWLQCCTYGRRNNARVSGSRGRPGAEPLFSILQSLIVGHLETQIAGFPVVVGTPLLLRGRVAELIM